MQVNLDAILRDDYTYIPKGILQQCMLIHLQGGGGSV